MQPAEDKISALEGPSASRRLALGAMLSGFAVALTSCAKPAKSLREWNDFRIKLHTQVRDVYDALGEIGYHQSSSFSEQEKWGPKERAQVCRAVFRRLETDCDLEKLWKEDQLDDITLNERIKTAIIQCLELVTVQREDQRKEPPEHKFED